MRSRYCRQNRLNFYRRATNLSALGRKERSHCLLKLKIISIFVQVKEQVEAMKIVTFTEARNKLKAVLDRVVDDADYTIITRRDADDTVVMSLEYFNSLLETVHLLKSPANAAHLERSIAQYRQGQVTAKDLLDE